MPPERHSVFALIGAVGAGKTSFASLASDGRKHLKVGTGAKSCTRKPQEVTFRFEGQLVTLIDTPGFGDPDREDEEVLERIARYLGERYGDGLLLDGLILFHPAISSSSTSRVSEKDVTEIVKRMLGLEAYQRVAITSTMWDTIPNRAQARAILEEGQRKQPGGVWHSMCSQGAVVFRHDNTKASADTIIRFLASRPDRPFPVQMQEELVSQKGHLASTSAGREMDRQLQEQALQTRRIQQNVIQGNTERSRKREKELEKELEDLTNRRRKFDRIKENADSHGNLKILLGGFFAQLSLIFAPDQAASSPGGTLLMPPAPERFVLTSQGETAELEGSSGRKKVTVGWDGEGVGYGSRHRG